MANKNGNWLRHYIDAHRNLKLRRLPEPTQLFFWWLCELRKAEVYPCAAADIAWHLRVDVQRVEEDLVRLRDAGLVLSDGDIKGWDERQYECDGRSSTDRVRRHRDRKRQADSDETQCNVSPMLHETPPEQNRTDTEQIQSRARETRAPALRDRSGQVLDMTKCDDLDLIAPTERQQIMLRSKANAAGVTLDQVSSELGVPLAAVNVDRFLAHLEIKARKLKTFSDQKSENTDEATRRVLEGIANDEI